MEGITDWRRPNFIVTRRGIGVLWARCIFDHRREPWSLTQLVAYWAGGLDPMEQGDPGCTETPTINHLNKSLKKIACLQLRHDRHLVPQQPFPMLLNANPDRMTPLIQGLPDSKYAVQLQDRLQDALAPRGWEKESARESYDPGGGRIRTD